MVKRQKLKIIFVLLLFFLSSIPFAQAALGDITYLNINPDTVQASDAVLISADVKNIGEPGNVYLGWSVLGPGGYECNLPPFRDYRSTGSTASFSWVHAVPSDAEEGTYTVKAATWDSCSNYCTVWDNPCNICPSGCCPSGWCSGFHNNMVEDTFKVVCSDECSWGQKTCYIGGLRVDMCRSCTSQICQDCDNDNCLEWCGYQSCNDYCYYGECVECYQDSHCPADEWLCDGETKYLRDYYCNDGSCDYTDKNFYNCNRDNSYTCYNDNTKKNIDYYCAEGGCHPRMDYEDCPWREHCLEQGNGAVCVECTEDTHCDYLNGYVCTDKYFGDERSEYRDYSCSSNECVYSFSVIADCNQQDGRYCIDNYSIEDRDYFCDRDNGQCGYSSSNQQICHGFCVGPDKNARCVECRDQKDCPRGQLCHDDTCVEVETYCQDLCFSIATPYINPIGIHEDDMDHVTTESIIFEDDETLPFLFDVVFNISVIDDEINHSHIEGLELKAEPIDYIFVFELEYGEWNYVEEDFFNALNCMGNVKDVDSIITATTKVGMAKEALMSFLKKIVEKTALFTIKYFEDSHNTYRFALITYKDTDFSEFYYIRGGRWIKIPLKLGDIIYIHNEIKKFESLRGKPISLLLYFLCRLFQEHYADTGIPLWAKKCWYWKLFSPADIHLFDENGNHVGLNSSGGVDRDIPGVFYSGPEEHPESIFIMNSEKSLELLVKGNDYGTFDLGGNISKGNIHKEIKYSAVAITSETNTKIELNDIEPYLLEVDEDGDGIFDYNKSPDDMDYSPVVSFNFHPSNPIVYEMIQFNASGSYDQDGKITQYYWNFGDGNTYSSDEAFVEHFYNESGNFSVVLTVEDDNEKVTSLLKTVTVRDNGVKIKVLIDSEETVRKDNFFDFPINITCLVPDCGNITATLDPCSADDDCGTDDFVSDGYCGDGREIGYVEELMALNSFGGANPASFYCYLLYPDQPERFGTCHYAGRANDTYNSVICEGECGYGCVCVPDCGHPTSLSCQKATEVECICSGSSCSSPCVFPDGSSCSKWNFYKGECGSEWSYCALNGYDTIPNINSAICALNEHSVYRDFLNNVCKNDECVNFTRPVLSEKCLYRCKDGMCTAKGIIPMVSGNPFYTTNDNPNTGCISLEMGESCMITWHVNATGDVNTTHEFFVIVNSSLFSSEFESEHVNITISDASSSAISRKRIVASYDFNEGNGSIANDKSGYGNHGTVYDASWTDGIEGSGLLFDGSSSFVVIADSPSLNPENEISISAWVKPAQTKSGFQFIVSKQFYPHGYTLFYSFNKLRFEINANGSYATASDNIEADKWYHVVGVYDGENISIYVNGKLHNRKFLGLKLNQSDRDLKIGSWAAGGYHFNGTIDEVKIFNYALPESKIQEEFSSLAPDQDSDEYNLSEDCNDSNSFIHPNATETCNGLDDNCNGEIDEGGNILCDDNLFCNGEEICDGLNGCQIATPPDCFGNNFKIESCFYIPDGINHTFDFYRFVSVCDEDNDVCTEVPAGWENGISHTCNFSCGAECEKDEDCNATECNYMDGCKGSDYWDYHDVNNSCLSDCVCEKKKCTIVDIYNNDERCTECQTDEDCNATECDYMDGCMGSDYWDYHDVNNSCLDNNTCEEGECRVVDIYINDERCTFCETDSDCDYLDGDFCEDELIKHNEGRCIDNECVIELSTLADCSENNIYYCSGTEIKYDNYLCDDADSIRCVFDAVQTLKDCDDRLWCNGQESCENASCVAGTGVNCSGNDFLLVDCFYDPDGMNYTFDFYRFVSVCDEDNDVCTEVPAGWENGISHTCNFSCGAECEKDEDCNATECNYMDGYYGFFYRDYYDVENNCEDCFCTHRLCENHTANITLELRKGWNLVSIPLIIENDSIENVFGPVMDKLTVINSFFEQGALTYDPRLAEFSDLHKIDYLHGYWIKMNETVNLTVSGAVPADKTINLSRGWNLISCLSNESENMTDVFSDVMNKVIIIHGFDDGGLTYDPELPEFSDLEVIRPGFGYWVRMNESYALDYS